MQPRKTQDALPADEAAIRAIPQRMIDAWNAGDADAFAAPFADDADFVAFEGTHLAGREAIAAFHREIFATAVKGSRLAGGTRLVRFVTPEIAVVHGTVTVTLPGASQPSPSRDSMQLFVVAKRDGEWRVEASLNARRLTLERQLFLDDVDRLPPEDRRRVTELPASLLGGARAAR